MSSIRRRRRTANRVDVGAPRDERQEQQRDDRGSEHDAWLVHAVPVVLVWSRPVSACMHGAPRADGGMECMRREPNARDEHRLSRARALATQPHATRLRAKVGGSSSKPQCTPVFLVDERAHLAGRTDVEVARLNRLLVRIEVVPDGGEPRGVLGDARVETHRERG